MKMREIIKNVAELISNLQILNIIKKKKDITTTIILDEQTKKYILTVTVIVSENISSLCLEMFQTLIDYGYVMSIDNLHTSISVKIYEQ